MGPSDERHLRRAIELARFARSAGNPPFGSLVVGPDGSVIREEMNTTLTGDDITAHPELKLARWVARTLKARVAAETTMYTSCEPCSMCRAAIERSGVRRVVFALSSEQLGSLEGNRSANGARLQMEGPALLEAARAAVDGYYD